MGNSGGAARQHQSQQDEHEYDPYVQGGTDQTDQPDPFHLSARSLKGGAAAVPGSKDARQSARNKEAESAGGEGGSSSGEPAGRDRSDAGPSRSSASAQPAQGLAAVPENAAPSSNTSPREIKSSRQPGAYGSPDKHGKHGGNMFSRRDKMKKKEDMSADSARLFVSAQSVKASDIPQPDSSSGKGFDELYRLKEVLGTGAFSTVREGYHRGHRDRMFAVKCVNRSKLTEEDTAALLDEVAILKELRHAHIIRLYDFFEEPVNYYLVMEKMTGGELFDRVVAKAYYNEKEARDTCQIILEAVGYCHRHDIAHRDLKPENLLLVSDDNDSAVKIADFGFAKKVLKPKSLSTQCGTPGYVAPEILEGTPYDTKADMWSVGVILYILLGGYPPFIENNQRELFRKIRRGDFEFHEEYWGAISADAKGLISSLLTVDPTKRLDAKQALRSPWMVEDDTTLANHDLGANLEEFKKFNAKRKFKAAVKGVVAANMMKTFVGGAKATSLERKLTEEDIADLKETFTMFDKDGGGTISMAELKGVMERLGTKVSDKELRDIISNVDENNDGEIDLEEFISMMKKMPEKKNELREAFKTFDADGDGSTTRSELRRILIKFGQHLSDQELDAVMLEVDKNRDGVISFEEFAQAMDTYKPASFQG